MSTEVPPPPRHRRIHAVLTSNTYIILVLVLTIFSLLIMAVQFVLKPDTPTFDLANTYNNLLCYFFLFDFVLRMLDAPRVRDYFIGERGYFDLLGSIPSFGISQYTNILRLFRLSRLLRLRRFMNPENRALLRNEIVNNRGQYALFITVLLAGLVLMTASTLVLFFESQNPDANIQSGGDALWWSTVTITTVGYGDRFPITSGGRLTAVLVMFSGVGIIGALASILASILVPPPKPPTPPPAPPAAPEVPAAAEALPSGDTKARLLELQALLEAQEKANAELRGKLQEIQKEL